MAIFGRLDYRAQSAINVARQTAMRFKHHYIDSDHLLLGLLTVGRSAVPALPPTVNVKSVTDAMLQILGEGKELPSKLELSEQLKHIMEQAIISAARKGEALVTCAHLWSSLLEENDSSAVRILTGMGCSAADLRQSVTFEREQQAAVQINVQPMGQAEHRETVKQKEEEAFPVFSKSPFIQELVRLATGVAKNQYRPDVLKEKVRWMKERHKEFKNDFNNLKTSPTENEDVDKLIPVAEKALNAMGNALEEMDSFFRNGDKSKLKHSCEVLLQSGEVLIAVQERLIKASSAQPAACPQCGVINPGGAKTCKECGATLPEIAGIAKQTMEVKEADPNARPRFAYLSRIEDAVENRIRGAISTAELKKHIDFFAAKARNGRKQFEAMKFPDNLTDEEREAAKRAYDLLDQGTATTVKGVEKLEAYIKSESLDDLNVGMDLIHKGADLIIDSQS